MAASGLRAPKMALHPCDRDRIQKQLPRLSLIEAAFARRTFPVAYQRLSWRRTLT